MHLLKTTNRLRRRFPNSESKLGFMGYLFLGICFFSPSTLLGTEREKNPNGGGEIDAKDKQLLSIST